MWKENHYPLIEVDLEKLKHNAKQTIAQCAEYGIKVSAVVKGVSGMPEAIKAIAECGPAHIASSRLEHLFTAKQQGVELPMMLIRVPMLSEAEEAVRIADISMQSDMTVMRAFNEEARRQGKVHKVLIMLDLGDLREGFWDREEAIAAALEVENDLDCLELAGVGTNLGCYGSIIPTPEKLTELVERAQEIEQKIGRKLEFVSGGGTTAFARVFQKNMPKGINHLRIGEHIIHAKELRDVWGLGIKGMCDDAFVLKAEVIEVRDKPTMPVGERFVDAFCRVREYEDRGIRRRLLVAVGKADYGGDHTELMPREKGIEVIGASSDHTIIDVHEAEKDLNIGDILEFDMKYMGLMYASHSPNVNIVIK